MKGLFKTGMREEEMEGCKNTTIDNKNIEEGRGYGQHLATQSIQQSRKDGGRWYTYS